MNMQAHHSDDRKITGSRVRNEDHIVSFFYEFLVSVSNLANTFVKV